MKLTQEDIITIIGDSLAKGIVYDAAEKRHVQLTDNAVALIARDYGVTINNRSVFGLTLKKAIERDMAGNLVKKYSVPGHRHFVVVALGGNDSDFNWGEIAEKPFDTHWSNSTMQEFSLLLKNMIDRIRELGATPVFFSIPPLDAVQYYFHISERVDGRKVLEWLHGDINNIYRYQESFNLAIVKTALENRCILLDVRSVMLQDINYKNYLCVDGIHLNEAGHRFIATEAEKLIDAL